VFYLPQGLRDAGDTTGAIPVAVPDESFILVVDDEPSILRIAQRCIERRGLTVQTASDGIAALSILRAAPERVQLLVTDISMPRLTGEDLLRVSRTIHPGLRAIVMSGHGPSVDLERLGGPLTVVLPKPFRAADLDAAIESILPSIGTPA
jgi:DNA-binding NtrC family response regulator